MTFSIAERTSCLPAMVAGEPMNAHPAATSEPITAASEREPEDVPLFWIWSDDAQS